jgi:hypothetical protein
MYYFDWTFVKFDKDSQNNDRKTEGKSNAVGKCKGKENMDTNYYLTSFLA